MMAQFIRRGLAPAALLVFLGLAGCQNTSPRAPAPVEDRKPVTKPVAQRVTSSPPAAETTESKPAEPGTYVVKPGDTLTRISLETGQGWRDLARWNNLENPNLIEVGQVLRVRPPSADLTAATTRPVQPSKVDGKPLDTKSAASTVAAAASAPASAASAPVPVSKDPEDDIQWGWPTGNSVIANFDEPKVKGTVFGGKAGDPVLAAAEGRVIYANSGLRGYGNLIIIKHSANYLTAYAHNQTLLVKEDQAVRKGQKIAEMGNSDAERVQLHFEVRRQGKPIDPAKVLPSR